MADEARLLFDNTLLQAQFDILVAVLGLIKPGTNVDHEQLGQMKETVFAIRGMLLKEMDFGR